MNRQEKIIKINLKNILKDRKITAAKMSNDTGISPNALGKIINEDSSSIHFETISTILDYLEIPLGDLISYPPTAPKDLKIELTNLEIFSDGRVPSNLTSIDNDIVENNIEETDRYLWDISFRCVLNYKKFEFNFESKVTIDIEFYNDELLEGSVDFDEDDFRTINEMFIKSETLLYEIQKQIKIQTLDILEKDIDPENQINLNLSKDFRIK